MCIILAGTGNFDCWLSFLVNFIFTIFVVTQRHCQVEDTFMNLFNVSLISNHTVTGGVLNFSTSKFSQLLPTVQTTNHLFTILGLKRCTGKAHACTDPSVRHMNNDICSKNFGALGHNWIYQVE